MIVLQEDEDEEQNEYEADGFIVDDAEEDDEGEADEGEAEQAARKKRKKKRRREREHRLDDDDYDLLEENQVQVGTHCLGCACLLLLPLEQRHHPAHTHTTATWLHARRASNGPAVESA